MGKDMHGEATSTHSLVVAATGHRPNKLGGYGDDNVRMLTELAVDWLCVASKLIPMSIRILSGMALGWDQAVADAGLSLGFHVTACLPCDGQDGRWPESSQHRYRELLGRCSEVVVVSPGPYELWKMRRRNQYMVDRANLVLALCNGTPGGTLNCVDYASDRRVKVENLWDLYKYRVKSDPTLSRY